MNKMLGVILTVAILTNLAFTSFVHASSVPMVVTTPQQSFERTKEFRKLVQELDKEDVHLTESTVTESEGITMVNYRTDSLLVVGVSAIMRSPSLELAEIAVARRVGDSEIEVEGLISGISRVMTIPPILTDPAAGEVGTMSLTMVILSSAFLYVLSDVFINAFAVNLGWSVYGTGFLFGITVGMIDYYGNVVDSWVDYELRDLTPIYEEAPDGSRLYY